MARTIMTWVVVGLMRPRHHFREATVRDSILLSRYLSVKVEEET